MMTLWYEYDNGVRIPIRKNVNSIQQVLTALETLPCSVLHYVEPNGDVYFRVNLSSGELLSLYLTIN